MSAARRAGLLSRYSLVKAASAVEEAFSEAKDWGDALNRFRQSMASNMTTTIAMAGAAMVPSLNRASEQDQGAYERLVVRLISKPSPRNIAVGDVVAFTNPLDQKAMMVRRVAALERTRMVSDDPEDAEFVIPPNHCWVLADNPALQPPDVIDSRVFGHVDMSTIMGRIIYRIASADSHGPVTNSPQAAAADQAVIEHEVDVEQLLAQTGSEQ